MVVERADELIDREPLTAREISHLHRAFATRMINDDQPIGCVSWLGSFAGPGQPKLNFRGRTVLATRLLYRLRVGRIPVEHMMIRVCNFRGCMNEHHIAAIPEDDNPYSMPMALRKAIFTSAALSAVFRKVEVLIPTISPCLAPGQYVLNPICADRSEGWEDRLMEAVNNQFGEKLPKYINVAKIVAGDYVINPNKLIDVEMFWEDVRNNINSIDVYEDRRAATDEEEAMMDQESTA